MLMRFLLFICLAFISSSACLASEKLLHFNVGETVLHIPVPNGFSDTSSSKELYALRAAATPAGRRLLTFLALEKEYESFQTGKEAEFYESLTIQAQANGAASVSKLSFADSRKKLREQLKTITAEVEAKTPERVAAISQDVSRQLNTTVKLKVSEVVQLGVFEESDTSISFAFLSTVQTQTPASTATETAVTAQTIALVKNKPVWLLTRLPYRGQFDVDRAKALSKAWLASINSAN